ncbi:MAG: aldehyde dehydrogenase family protein [Achromobacter pulmonis]
MADPVEAATRIVPLGAPHEKIPLPRELYGSVRQGARANSAGLDLSNEHRLGSLAAALLASAATPWRAGPMLGDGEGAWDPARAVDVRNPANLRDVVGQVIEANAEEAEAALRAAANAAPIWQSTPVAERAQCLRRAAQLLEEQMQTLLGLIVREAGKSLPNAIAEVREAVDFLRYYADQADREFGNDTHSPLGTVVCISPWNFPLAIFTGQVAAALVAGNTVLAKPAEQTPLIAAQAVTHPARGRRAGRRRPVAAGPRRDRGRPTGGQRRRARRHVHRLDRRGAHHRSARWPIAWTTTATADSADRRNRRPERHDRGFLGAGRAGGVRRAQPRLSIAPASAARRCACCACSRTIADRVLTMLQWRAARVEHRPPRPPVGRRRPGHRRPRRAGQHRAPYRRDARRRAHRVEQVALNGECRQWHLRGADHHRDRSASAS